MEKMTVKTITKKELASRVSKRFNASIKEKREREKKFRKKIGYNLERKFAGIKPDDTAHFIGMVFEEIISAITEKDEKLILGGIGIFGAKVIEKLSVDGSYKQVISTPSFKPASTIINKRVVKIGESDAPI